MSPIPVVVCGRNPNIAKVVAQTLAPEYEVTHIILSVESGATDIPLLLKSQTSTLKATPNFGTQNYANPPAAIVTGGGFDDEAFKTLRDVCSGADVKNVPWFRPDLTRLNDGPDLSDTEGYGRWIGERTKKALLELGVGAEGAEEKEEWKEKFYYF